jgi:putative peptidoglycan lipid II flippase
VPLLAQSHATQTREEQQRFLDAVATVQFWVLLAVTVIGVAGAPLLVYLLASGLHHKGDGFDEAVVMTRIMFPYILFMSLVAFSAGILNTWKHFAVPAATPVLLNVAVIVCGLLLSKVVQPPIYALAIGVLAGGLLQLALQWPALKRHAVLPRVHAGLRSAWRDAQVQRVIRQMLPATLAVSVAQLSLIINTQIASHLQTRSITWINAADRLMEFPTALIGVALGVVLIPSLTRAHATGDRARYNDILDWGLRLVLLLALPAAVALLVFAKPLVAVMYHYRAFTDDNVAPTALALACYGVGLLGLVGVKVLAPGFYAQQDIRTPVKIALLVLAVTQGFNLLFVPLLAHAGLTLAIALGALLNCGLLLWGLRRRGSYTPHAGWWAFLGKVLAACALMGALLWLASERIDWLGLRHQPWLRIGLLLAVIAAAAAAYFAVLWALGLRARQFMQRA